MRNISDTIDTWLLAGREVVVATVTRTWGSSPRPAGAMMAFTSDGDMAGSVSGGCIEGTVAQAAVEVFKTGTPELLSFTASYQAAWDVGLACGGEIEVIVQALDKKRHQAERRVLIEDRGYARLILVRGDTALLGGTVLINDEGIVFSSLDDTLSCELESAFACVPFSQTSGFLELQAQGEPLVFSFSRERARPQLVCVGATHVAAFLAQIAYPLGYSTVIIDPRGLFATVSRFPHVDKLLHAWPQEAFKQIEVSRETAICVLTHDPKIDVPALELAVTSPAFYIGSLGRPTTQRQRYRSLVERGFSVTDIQRVYGPIGLDLGGKLPEELALSIFAEITAVRYGRNGTSRRMHEFAEKEAQ
jgi:xanthine dehydrogenase accessory factor